MACFSPLTAKRAETITLDEISVFRCLKSISLRGLQRHASAKLRLNWPNALERPLDEISLDASLH